MSTITEQHFWSNTCDALGMEDARDLPLAEQLDRHEEPPGALDAAMARCPRRRRWRG